MKKLIKVPILTILIIFTSLSLFSFAIDKTPKTLFKSNSFIKSTHIPSNLYVIDITSLKKSECTMIASIQGLLSNRCDSQIYLINKNNPSYKDWLSDLNKNYRIQYKVIDNPYKLLTIFKDYIDGYILYSQNNSKDPSINNASSLASLTNSIIITDDLENKVKSFGIKNLTGDCRNTDSSWAFKNLWNSGLNHSTVIELSPKTSDSLRDYGIMTKSLVFYDDSKDQSLKKKIYSSISKGGISLSLNTGDVSLASTYGVSKIEADLAYNLSVLSSLPNKKIDKHNKSTSLENKDKHYITFIMGNGENLNWFLGNNYSNFKFFSYAEGNPPLGWGISESLYYL